MIVGQLARDGRRCRLGKTGIQRQPFVQWKFLLDRLSASERSEGRRDFRTVLDEKVVEVDHTKESSALASGSMAGALARLFTI